MNHPPLPVGDDVTRPFWDGAREGKLLVQRCSDCRRYQFPPDRSCGSCASAHVAYEQVSGRGTVFSFTETVTGARHPYFQSISPYLVGQVQLDLQEGLVFASNFPGAAYDDLAIGAPVDVEFQEIADGVVMPQFRLIDGRAGR